MRQKWRIGSKPRPVISATAAASAASALVRAKVRPRLDVATRPDEVVQYVREPVQIGKLAGRRRIAALSETVDPNAGETELVRGGDVMEVARTHVDVTVVIGMRPREELRPVAMSRLVGA